MAPSRELFRKNPHHNSVKNETDFVFARAMLPHFPKHDLLKYQPDEIPL